MNLERVSVILVLVTLLLLGSAPATHYHGANFVGGGEDRLEVLCRSTEGKILAGVVLHLCLVPKPGEVDHSKCLLSISKKDGLAAFENIPPGSYQLRGHQEGWADTIIETLRFGGADPIPPLRVSLVFNPECFHC